MSKTYLLSLETHGLELFTQLSLWCTEVCLWVIAPCIIFLTVPWKTEAVLFFSGTPTMFHRVLIFALGLLHGPGHGSLFNFIIAPIWRVHRSWRMFFCPLCLTLKRWEGRISVCSNSMGIIQWHLLFYTSQCVFVLLSSAYAPSDHENHENKQHWNIEHT